MLYTIYKVTNLLNGKIYVGKHQTENINDGYYGSGKAIKNAIKKYGKENFKKEVLFVLDSEEEMNNKEKEIITEEFVLREDTYNLGVGGEGGPHFKGKKHSVETRKKIGQTEKCFSKEARQKISENNKKRIVKKETCKKISIQKYLANGKSIDEAVKLAENRNKKNKRTRSQALKEFYQNPDNRKKKSEQMTKLDKKYDLVSIKKDFDLGLKPRDIMKKYDMSKNTYDYVRSKYLIEN